MSDSRGLELRAPNLGGQRGLLSDWITQRWVQLTGKSVSLNDCPWLEGPVGDVELIGSAFFQRLAEKRNLDFVADGTVRGLIDNFAVLSSSACNPNEVDARVAAFYEKTSEFEFDIWSEWCGAIVYTAWVRDVVSTKRTLYAGSYSVCQVPGYPGPCVKVVFPLPNESAVVIMRPESGPDGSLTLRSVGVRFGDPGFYFFVEKEPGYGWARHVRTLQEVIRVYADAQGTLRADHDLWIWGARFRRLHYRMRKRAA